MHRGQRLPVTVALATALFAVTMFAVGVIRYRIFRAQVDLGIFTQVIASPFTGFSSTAEGGINHLAIHFSPILVLCSPLLALTRTPLALVAAQAALSAATIPAVYLIAARRSSRRIATFAALAAVAYPPLISMTVGDFHELAFATPTVLWFIWALDSRRFKVAAVLAIVAITIKEDVTLILATLACVIGLAARRNDRRLTHFMSVFVLAAAATLSAYYLVVRPMLGNLSAAPSSQYYNWHYAGPAPNGFAPLQSPLRLRYIEGVIVPMLGLPLLTPAFILALPGLIEVLASHQAITIDLSTHYVACWLPYVFFAFVLGVASVYRRSRKVAWAIVSCSLMISLWIDIFDSPAQWWYQIYRLPEARDTLLEHTLQRLPHDAPIGADLWIFAHLGLHPHATIDPTNARFVVVDRQCNTSYCKERIFPFVKATAARRTLRLLSSEKGIEVYMRFATQAEENRFSTADRF